jgi:hypothetical protein
MAGKKQAFKDILRNCFPVDVDNLLRDQEEETKGGENTVSSPDTVSATERVLEIHAPPLPDTVVPHDTVGAGEPVAAAATVCAGETVSPEGTVSVEATVLSGLAVAVEDTVSAYDTVSTSNRTEVASNYFRMDADVFDVLSEFQTPYERVVYLYLYRLSYGFNRQTCFVGLKSIIDNCKVSKNVVRRALETLEAKKQIRRLDRINERDLKGTIYRVFLPCEIPNLKSQTTIHIVEGAYPLSP